MLPFSAPTAAAVLSAAAATFELTAPFTAALERTPQLAEVFYDLKKFLEESKAAVPPQLASHEAAKTKPGTIGSGRPQVQFAKK